MISTRSIRPTEHAFRHLDIHALNRGGFLSEEASDRFALYTWGDGASIRVRGGPEAVQLAYQVRERDDGWEPAIDTVRLTWTACNYGGYRPWFVCPGCERRCGKLYGGRRFRCRRCVNLAYASTRESEPERLLGRAQRIRVRLGGEPNTFARFPEKPKGMHWRTYWRLRGESEEAAVWALRLALASCR